MKTKIPEIPNANYECSLCQSVDVYVSMIRKFKDGRTGEITRRFCKEHTTHRHWYEKAILMYQERNAGFSFVPKTKQEAEEYLDIVYAKLGRKRVPADRVDLEYNEAELLAGRKAI